MFFTVMQLNLCKQLWYLQVQIQVVTTQIRLHKRQAYIFQKLPSEQDHFPLLLVSLHWLWCT